MDPKIFSDRKYFPGREGTPFDKLLKGSVAIENMHSIGFILGLVIISITISKIIWLHAIFIFCFFALDWLCLTRLPKRRVSFGPSRPPVFVLALMRSIVFMLPFPIWTHVILQFIGSGLVVYGFWIEPHRICVSHEIMSIDKIRLSHPISILHLSDLHIERMTRRESQLSKLIKETKPDIIVFSGDLLNLSYLNDPICLQQAKSLLSQWRAPWGVYLVSGSPAVDFPDTIGTLIEGTPVKWLQNECASITLDSYGGVLNIFGIPCTHNPNDDAAGLQTLITARQRRFDQGVNVLLYHSPDIAPHAARLGFDLQLSGHTHGGQVRLPFFGALITGSLYGKRFEAGRYKIDSMDLYTSRGIGMEGGGAPRIRFLCPPEVILWKITNEGFEYS